MGELFQFVFSLDDKTGSSIVWLILIFFGIGVLNYLFHIAWIWWERINLSGAQTYFKTNQIPTDVSDLPTGFRKAKIPSKSIIYRRISDLVQIKQNGGQIDNDALADILTGEQSRKASFANYILGILIILGLIGTLRGLITAITEVQPLLQDIQNLDQLPTISDALRLTLSGMSTAFVTTLAGLLTSLALGFFGWLFNREQSAFLTQFERFISTEIIPRFTQTPESSIESAVTQLTECTNTLKFATQENVSAMRQAIQQLTDTSWGGQLEQQYILANKFGTTADNLLESLDKIGEYQILITSTVDSFEKLTVESMSHITEYQETLRHGLEDSVPRLEEESKVLKTAIEEYQEEYQRSLSRFIDDLSSTLQRQLQSITGNQQDMVNVLTQLVDELQIRSVLEVQNQVFERIEIQLTENQEEALHAFTQLANGLQDSFRSVLETQNQVFKDIETHLTENQQETVDVLTQLAGDSQTRFRSALETQNEVFRGIQTQLVENQQGTVDVLTRLADGLQVHFHSVLETQNEVFRGIQTQLVENQQGTVDVLTRLADDSQIRFRSVLETQTQVFRGIQTQLTENQREIVGVLTQLTDELQIRSVLEAQNQVFERIETQLIGNQRGIFDALTQLAGELQIRSTLEAQNQVFGRIESHLIRNGDIVAEQNKLMQTLIANLQQPSQTASAPTKLASGGDSSHQISSQLLDQISLKFDMLNGKIDTLNNTMRQPGVYRWISEIRRWFGASR